MEEIATIKEVLQFIHDCYYIQPWELANEFGYTLKFARNKIHRLKVSGLVENKRYYGKWNLTEKGEGRLDYYNSQHKKDRKDVLKARQEGYKNARLFSMGVCGKCGKPLFWNLDDPKDGELLLKAVNKAQYIHGFCSQGSPL